MGSLKIRSLESEILDNLTCSGLDVDQNLKELEVINKWLGGDNVTINGIKKLLDGVNTKAQTITIADLGCGGGDMLIKIARWARKKQIKVKLFGVDANPYIIEYARENSRSYDEIEYLPFNIFSKEFKSLNFDIITSTLFTHHFTDHELIDLYAQFYRQSNIGILTNDIHRHYLAFHSINLLTRLFSQSPMVKNDAGLSVQRAFKKSELRHILKRAGINKYELCWKWAFRWQLIVRKRGYLKEF